MAEQGERITTLRARIAQAREAGEIALPSARDILRIAFRQKFVILFTFIGLGAIGFAFVAMMPDVYESEARLYLRPERGDVSIDTASQGLVTTMPRQSANAAETELAILSSRTLLEQVAEQVGPERVLGLREGQTIESVFAKAPNPHAAALRAATRSLSRNSTSTVNGDVIVVAYRHYYPKVAHDITSALVELYMARSIQVHSSSANPEYFREQADGKLREIELKEQELKQYNEENNIQSLDEQRTSLLARKRSNDEALAQNRVNLKSSEAAIASLTKALYGRQKATDLPPTQMENPQVLVFKQRLTELEMEKIQLEAEFVNSRDLRIVNEQIDEIKKKIATLPATVPRTFTPGTSGAGEDPGLLLANEKVNRDRFLAVEEALTAELGRTMAELDKLGDDSQAKALEQELVGLREDYARLKSAADQMQTNADLDAYGVSNVRLLNPATLPDLPAGPRRLRNLAMVLFLALAAGVGLAFLREFLDDTLKSRDEVEKKLGMPVLAVVPNREFKKCI